MHKKVIKILLGVCACIVIWSTFQLSQLQREPREAVSMAPPDPPLFFGTQHPANFEAAKQVLRSLFPAGREIYCDCAYDLRRKQAVDPASCGYSARSPAGLRIEWEHVVPASLFGRRFAAWTQGHPVCQGPSKMQRGRACAREASLDFRRMEADLYNLRPAIGGLNRARSHYPFREIAGEERRFGSCDFERYGEGVEPPAHERGDIARVYFYMDTQYPGFGIVHADNEQLLTTWNDKDPMDASERLRIARIEQVQGNTFFVGRLRGLKQAREAF